VFGVTAAPAYYQEREDWPFMREVVEQVREGENEELMLTTERKAVQTTRFFEGTRDKLDLSAGQWLTSPLETWGKFSRFIYLEQWLKPLITWGVFIGFFYLANLCISGLLRKQWVDVERLIFPIARVPLDVSESSAKRILPTIVTNRAFIVGALLTLVFGLIRAAPVLFAGAKQGWTPGFPVQSILWETPISQLGIYRAYIFPLAIGFAFLVPADVALSMWFFFLFIHFEHQVAYWLGLPLEGGITGPFLSWQQAGSFIVFAGMLLWAARRHLGAVFKKAIGRGKDIDDSDEPLPYAWGFWGLVIAIVGMVAWYSAYGLGPFKAIILLILVFTILLTHARLVAQGGIFFVQQTWNPPQLLNSVTGGTFFGAQASIAAQMQHAILVADSREVLLPHSMNAFRISSVFDRNRRWFVPVLAIALVVAVVIGGLTTLHVYYNQGGLNTPNAHGMVAMPKHTYRVAEQMFSAQQTAEMDPHYFAFGFGALIMFFVTAMRARFYWWPVHSLGLLIGNTWPMQNLWFPFLLGWAVKAGILKFGRGSILRSARHFFMGVIIGESCVIGMSTLLGLLFNIKIGNIFLPV
jgi:hypothetical protein